MHAPKALSVLITTLRWCYIIVAFYSVCSLYVNGKPALDKIRGLFARRYMKTFFPYVVLIFLSVILFTLVAWGTVFLIGLPPTQNPLPFLPRSYNLSNEFWLQPKQDNNANFPTISFTWGIKGNARGFLSPLPEEVQWLCILMPRPDRQELAHLQAI